MEWINIKNGLPKHGNGSFLACWKNQGSIMLVCFVNIHGNYIIAGSDGDSCGHGNSPKFTHWMPLPDAPNKVE